MLLDEMTPKDEDGLLPSFSSVVFEKAKEEAKIEPPETVQEEEEEDDSQFSAIEEEEDEEDSFERERRTAKNKELINYEEKLKQLGQSLTEPAGQYIDSTAANFGDDDEDLLGGMPRFSIV